MVPEVITMLFKRKQKKKEPKPTFVLGVPHSDHFKGYKRIKLATYQDAEVDKGIEAVKAADEIREVTFKEYKFPDTSPLIRVYADGHKIGTIWSTSWTDLYKAIKSGRCTKASVAFNDLGDVFLFVKI